MQIPKRLKSKRIMAMFPLTFAILVVIAFVLFSMSPAMDGIFIKNASATYNISIDPSNHVTFVSLYGKLRSDSASSTSIASYTITEDGTNGVTAYASNSLVRVGGVITEIWAQGATDDADYEAYLDSIGYDGANVTYAQFRTIMKLTVTITNPNSVATSFDLFSYEPVGLDFMPYNNTKMSTDVEWIWHSNIPDYTFSVAGTYTFAYTWQVYY